MKTLALTLLTSLAAFDSPALALSSAAPAMPPQSVPTKVAQHPTLRLITALDGEAAARDFDAMMSKTGGVFVDKTKLAMTVAAIRMTERGKAGQEFGILIEDSTYRAQLDLCAQFVVAGFMTWIGPNNPDRVKDHQDWDAYLSFLSRYYSKPSAWKKFRGSGATPVHPNRDTAATQAWTESVQFFVRLQSKRMRDFRGSAKNPLVQGLADGLQTVEENGKKIAEGLVKDGHMEGPWVFFHKNGKKSLEGTFTHSRWQGEVKAWHINGNRKSVTMYEAGEAHGPASTYYGNGQPSSSGMNEDGHRTGEWKEFDYGGSPKGTATYKNGRKVRS